MRQVKLTIGVALALMPASAALGQRKAVTPPPIVQVPVPPPVFVPTPVIRTEKYGEWAVERFGKGYAAYTTNASGSVFGVVCTNTCLIYFNQGTSCDANESFPVLINASAGAFAVTLTCYHLEKRYLLLTDLSKNAIDAMEIGGELGVAVPLQSGQFKVTRFSLVGALKAASRALALAKAAGQAAPEKGLRDYVL